MARRTRSGVPLEVLRCCAGLQGGGAAAQHQRRVAGAEHPCPAPQQDELGRCRRGALAVAAACALYAAAAVWVSARAVGDIASRPASGPGALRGARATTTGGAREGK